VTPPTTSDHPPNETAGETSTCASSWPTTTSTANTPGSPPKLHYTNQAISAWGREQTGLPIDFQIQRRSLATAEYGGHFRNPMGLRTPASYVTC